MPKLSIVVPFYNVAPYIGQCLESLAVQTLRDLEVIMVDDGSPDDSSVIANAFAQRDPRFKLIRQDNSGPGPARNVGVEHAAGTYLAFADGDDIVSRSAYELLVTSLEKTGSDLACGNVRRFNTSRTWQSQLHTEPFAASSMKTHVQRQVSLIRDRTAWNKVFRRAFWDYHGFAFPRGLYEDPQVIIPAHVLAGSVDVHREHVYYWRQREGSITENKAQLENIEARMAMLEGVQAFLAEHAPQLQHIWDRYALDMDFPMLVGALGTASEPDQRRMVELGSGYLRRVAEQSIADQPALRRLMLHLLRRRMLGELCEVRRFEREELLTTPVVRRGLFRPRWYADYPFRRDRAIPDRVFDVTAELTLIARADRASWTGDRLLIEGHAYIKHLDLSSVRNARIRVWLRAPGEQEAGSRIELPVTRTRRPDVTAGSGLPGVSYDWSGFTVLIDPAVLTKAGVAAETTYELEAEVAARGLMREGALRNPLRGKEKWPMGRQIGGRTRIQPVATSENRFVVRATPITSLVTEYRADGEVLELSGWTTADLGPQPAVLVSRRHGGARATDPVTLTTRPDGRSGFVARLPLAWFVSAPEHSGICGGSGSSGTTPSTLYSGVDWDVVLTDGKRKVKLAVADRLGEARFPVADREIALTRTRYGNLRMVERSCRPVVGRMEWLAGDRLFLTGEYAGLEQGPQRFILRHRGNGQEHPLPVRWDGPRFKVEIPAAALPVCGSRLPLAAGYWDLLAPTRSGEVAVVMERDGLGGRLGTARTVAGHEMLVDVHAVDALHLWVRSALAIGERGAFAQHQIRTSDYPRFRKRKLEDLVVFASFRGLQYSDSPRAICAEIQRRGLGLDCVWETKDGQFTVGPQVTTVVTNSMAHYERLARARYVISNDPQPEWFVKRPGQTYLQTWHGTPLKRIGFDIDRPKFPSAETYLERFAADVAKWDMLLSPNPFSTPILRRAFRYDGEVLETGYPRNDLLLRPDRAHIADRVRATLGIAPGKRVVLYAPTWRDDQGGCGGYRLDLRLDLDAARRALGRDHVLLVRGHCKVGQALGGGHAGFAIDVSRYPDIAELYLIADVLITDYSSAMFDFAVTGRPMLFFTYDLEHYRDELRGFYFDFEADAPGPLLRTCEEVVAALDEIDDAVRPHKAAYEAFTERFCPLDDGGAAARVVDRLISG